jgi:hypothetical protein
MSPPKPKHGPKKDLDDYLEPFLVKSAPKYALDDFSDLGPAPSDLKVGDAPPTTPGRPTPLPSTDIEQAGKKGKHRRRVQELSDFLAEFIPPDYLVDGILQRGFCYSLTGKTGSGKSAIGLTFSMLVATKPRGQKFGEHDVEHGRVVYICKENPTDIMMRLMAMCFLEGISIEDVSRDFLVVQSIDNIDKDWPHIVAELKAYGDIALIVVDTSIALFTTEDENAPAQMYRHAKKMRALGTVCPGRPTVLVLCHPVKNPSGPDELPRRSWQYRPRLLLQLARQLLSEVDADARRRCNR